jgi:tetratricopeptide (TPR) repeat protein
VFRWRAGRPRHDDRRSPAADSLYAKGVAALDWGDPGVGRQALLESLRSDTVSLERVLDVAEQLASSGFIADVEKLLRNAIDQFVDRPEPKVAMAAFLLENGNERQAIQTVVQALRQHPRNPALNAIAARAYEAVGDLAEAANHLAVTLAIHADDLDANRRLAVILERLGDKAGSIRCLRRVVDATSTEDPEAVTVLGIALSQDGQHDEAVDLLSDVVRRFPNVSAARADLAMAQLAAGQVREALAGFTEALRLDGQSAQAFCGLGLAYQQLERWREAAEAFRKTEALAPDLAAGPFNLGLALGAAGDHEGAKEALLRAAALAPEDREIRDALQSLEPEVDSASAAAPAPAPTPHARFSGDLESFELSDVLEFLRLQNKTGSLVVLSARGAGIVRLVRGQLTSASAPGVMRLGEALVARGLITSEGLKAALARQKADEPDSAEALGSLLMRDRPRDHDQLRQAVFQQLLEALLEMIAWHEGAFSFHPADDPGLPAISFNLQNVMLELMRVIDERKKGTLPSQEDR